MYCEITRKKSKKIGKKVSVPYRIMIDMFLFFFVLVVGACVDLDNAEYGPHGLDPEPGELFCALVPAFLLFRQQFGGDFEYPFELGPGSCSVMIELFYGNDPLTVIRSLSHSCYPSDHGVSGPFR